MASFAGVRGHPMMLQSPLTRPMRLSPRCSAALAATASHTSLVVLLLLLLLRLLLLVDATPWRATAARRLPLLGRTPRWPICEPASACRIVTGAVERAPGAFCVEVLVSVPCDTRAWSRARLLHFLLK